LRQFNTWMLIDVYLKLSRSRKDVLLSLIYPGYRAQDRRALKFSFLWIFVCLMKDICLLLAKNNLHTSRPSSVVFMSGSLP